VRKITDLANGQRRDERIYLGDVEIYRRPGSAPLERRTLHLTDAGRRFALVETRTSGQEPNVPAVFIRYQFGNHLGSSSLELDETSQVVSYEEYTPFGSTAYQGVCRAEVKKRYRYSGKERDDESGLYYHGARYYAPWVVRWTSSDPAGLVDGPN